MKYPISIEVTQKFEITSERDMEEYTRFLMTVYKNIENTSLKISTTIKQTPQINENRTS